MIRSALNCGSWLGSGVSSYNSHMEKATVSKLKNNLSAYLRKVRAGSAVVIYERDVPIARLERIESTDRGADRLKLLDAEGVTRPPRHHLTPQTMRELLGKPLARESRLLEALERDRSEDR
jgi:antitoxin (DNA-binding transcriptional repressor) of toxin-antitoxin stability system